MVSSHLTACNKSIMLFPGHGFPSPRGYQGDADTHTHSWCTPQINDDDDAGRGGAGQGRASQGRDKTWQGKDKTKPFGLVVVCHEGWVCSLIRRVPLSGILDRELRLSLLRTSSYRDASPLRNRGITNGGSENCPVPQMPIGEPATPTSRQRSEVRSFSYE